MFKQLHNLTAHDWIVIAVLAAVLAAAFVTITIFNPRLRRALGLDDRIGRAADWAINSQLFSAEAWPKRTMRWVLIRYLNRIADQTIQTIIILPIVFTAWATIWLFDHLPRFSHAILEWAPWLGGAIPELVVLGGLSIIAFGFWLRETHARTYGVIEIGVAIAALYIVGGLPSISVGLLPFASAIYVGVRGCDNVRRGIKVAANKRVAGC